MRELFTKGFWNGVKKTFEEAQKEPPAPAQTVEPVAAENAAPTGETATSRQEAV